MPPADVPTLYEWAGGPKRYTEERGGYPHMLSKHRNRALTAAPPPKAPVPRWGWGEAPPYLG